jgi:hypothetical protein
MKRLLMIVALIVVSASCASYSAVDKSKPDNIISAGIDTVWEKTLEVLNAEGMKLEKTNENSHFIRATQYVKRSRGSIDWTQGPELTIRLTPSGGSEGNQTKIKIKGVFNYFARESRSPVVLDDDDSVRYMDELINRISVGVKAFSEGQTVE